MISLEERINTTSATGELVFHVFDATAHFERRLIAERTRDGIAAARRRRRNPGRLLLSGETVTAVKKLFEAGIMPGQVAKQLGIGRSTAYRIAKLLDVGNDENRREQVQYRRKTTKGTEKSGRGQ